VLPSVGDKKKQISLSRGVVLSQSTFHLVHSFILSFIRSFVDCLQEKCVILSVVTVRCFIIFRSLLARRTCHSDSSTARFYQKPFVARNPSLQTSVTV